MSGELLSMAGKFLLSASRSAVWNVVDEECFYERVKGIENAVYAMKDAKVDDEVIISMLQRYWDLRLSEAEKFVLSDCNTK